MLLGVNVDHVATLRNARGTVYPDPIEWALRAEKAGVHNITCHLREDRRHIKDVDVFNLKKVLKIPLNLEMACTPEMVKIALRIKPTWVTWVPEKRSELTTEGGLDVFGNSSALQAAATLLAESGIPTSLFIDANSANFQTVIKMKHIQSVEIHTGHYADAQDEHSKENELEKIFTAIDFYSKQKKEVHIGHGLNLKNLNPFIKKANIHSAQIGHAIIAQSVFEGVESTLQQYLRDLSGV